MSAVIVGAMSALIALASAIASIVSARAARQSAKNSEASVAQTARQQRVALERDANRSIHQVFATATRVIELADRLERSYKTEFALHGRNVGAAKPLVDQVAVKRAEAEVARESAHECDWEHLQDLKDSEIEGYLRASENHLAHLKKLEDSLVFDITLCEEENRRARDNMARKNLAPPPP